MFHQFSASQFALILVLSLSLVNLGQAGSCPHQNYPSAIRFSSLNLATGTILTIPAGQTYLFDLSSSPILGGVLVYGRLVFDEGTLLLRSHHITVFSGGEFLIGGCDCPYSGKATIELYNGNDLNEDPHGFGIKVIGVAAGGRLEFHGQVFGPTWTRLAQSASAGATTITLKENVQWRTGDKIIIAGTGYVNGWYSTEATWNEQTEEHTVVSVNGPVVTLSAPLKYPHMGETIDGVELRAEVGSLTRNIVVQGDSSSDSSHFGSHTMFLEGSSIQLKGVEFTRGGQYKFLGRYPVHFHRFGDATGYAVEDCSIHHCYQRCFTFHGVHNLTAVRNVAYWTRGHCFFLEDGIETGNYIAHNLAVRTHKIPPADQLPGIQSDNSPTLFWITHPSNHFIGNAAVSSPSHCMWIALPIHPTGPSFTWEVLPRHAPLGRFEHNTIHGCGVDGIHIDNGPNQEGVPGGPNSDNPIQAINAENVTVSHNVGSGYYPYGSQWRTQFLKAGRTPAIFESLTVWKVRNQGVWTRGGPHYFYRYKSAGNRIGITLAIGVLSKVIDSIFVGDIENDFFGNYPIRGYEFYDGPNGLYNARCSRFIPDATNEASCISMLRTDRFSIAATNHVEDIHILDNSKMLYFPDKVHDGDFGATFIDFDGSVTGRPPQGLNRAAVVNALPFHLTPGCIENPSSLTAYCPDHFFHLRLSQTGVSAYPTPTTVRDLPGLWRITRQDKINSPLYICGGQCNDPASNEYMDPYVNSGFAIMMLYRTYYFHWMGPGAARELDLVGIGQPFTANENGQPPLNEFIIGICYPAGSSNPQMRWSWRDNPIMASSLNDMKTRTPVWAWNTRGDGMWYWDQANNYLWVRMIMNNDQVNQKYDTYGDWFSVKIKMGTLGSGPSNCPMSQTSLQADTIKTLPPVGPVPPPPPQAPPPPLDPRGQMSCGPVPPVDCEVSQWTSWTSCSGPCGSSGTRSRSRTVIVPPQGSGATCPELTQTDNTCQMNPCPVDCILSSFSGWGECVGTCGTTVTTGSQNRTRTVITPEAHGGTCPPLIEFQPCTIQPCTVPVDCILGDWTSYGPCMGACGGSGTQTRTRDILTSPQNGGLPCEETSETITCIPVCPIDCIVSDWSQWSQCNAVCGETETKEGIATRTRNVTQEAQNGGNPCPELYQQMECTITCNVDCVMHPWTEWHPCDGICGSQIGLQTRSRIVKIFAVNNGTQCPHETESRACTDPCTVSMDVMSGQSYPTVIKVAAVSYTKVKFTVTSKTTGWIGIGIPKNPTVMLNSDAVIGWASSSSSSIRDYHIGEEASLGCPSGVCEDSQSNIEEEAISEENGFTTMTWVREKKTGDPQDVPLVDVDLLQHINVAVGETDTLGYHGTNRASLTFIMPRYNPPQSPPPSEQSPPPSDSVNPSDIVPPPSASAPSDGAPSANAPSDSAPSDSAPSNSPPSDFVPPPPPSSPDAPSNPGNDEQSNQSDLEKDAGGVPVWVWIVVAAAALLLIIIIVVVVVLVKRSKGTSSYKFDNF